MSIKQKSTVESRSELRKTFPKKCLGGVSVAVLASGFAFAPVYAQEAADAPEESRRLGVVTVNARKVEENLQDVPVSVTAFDGAALEAQGAVEFSDLAAFTPGFSTTPGTANPSAFSLSIRGQVQNDVLATLEPSIGTYVDGLYWARAYGLNQDLLDIENVQVLKGPQGTLFGRNTTGGAVLLNTNDPELSGGLSGLVKGRIGNLDERTGTVVVNMPIVEDKFAIRGALQVSKRDGYIEDVLTGQDYNNRDNTQGRIKARWAPTNNLDIVVSGEWYDSDTRQGAFVTEYAYPFPPTPGPRLLNTFIPTPFGTVDNYLDLTGPSEGKSKVALNAEPFIEISTETYTGEAVWGTDIGEFTFITGYRKVENTNQLDLDGSPWPAHATTLDQDLDQFSAELQLAREELGGRLTYVVGATYFEEGGTDSSTTVALTPVNPLDTTFNGEIDNQSIGLFLQGTYALTDQINLNAGVRYAQDEKGITTSGVRVVRATGDVNLCLVDVAIPPDCLAPSRTDTFEEVPYMVGLDYSPNDNWLIYGKFSHGYRAGGQQLRAVSTETQTPFEPEIVDEVEIGFKADLMQSRLRLNVAAYANEVQDLQRSTIFTDDRQINYTLLENAAEATNKGVEAELTALLTDNFTVQASGSLNNPEYETFIDAQGNDRSSENFTYVPEEMFTLAGIYETSTRFGHLNARVDYSWQGETPYDGFNNPAFPEASATVIGEAAGVLGARATLSVTDQLDLTVWGKNLTDEDAYINTLLVGGLGYSSVIPREPLTYGVTATYRFGQ
ncbi:TonB-dependent receptor [Henriciella aquimarina]|uniref:TonB-dependent receptor n=1 Tax=Henriciella aquimarina TaxID=545261 RepID=UPI001301E97C|nr:TonB-dependent receptor [Henriciella aquimarina]